MHATTKTMTLAIGIALLAGLALPGMATAQETTTIVKDDRVKIRYDVTLVLNGQEEEHSGTWIVGPGGQDCGGAGESDLTGVHYIYMCGPSPTSQPRLNLAVDPVVPPDLTVRYHVTVTAAGHSQEHSGVWEVGPGGLDCAGGGEVQNSQYFYQCSDL